MDTKELFKHLSISINGGSMPLTTEQGLIVAVGYNRIVETSKGIFVEFSAKEISISNFCFPIQNESGTHFLWRSDDGCLIMHQYKTFIPNQSFRAEYYYIDVKTLYWKGKRIYV